MPKKKAVTSKKKRAAKKSKKPSEPAPPPTVKIQQEVAKHFGVSIKTVQSWRLRGMPGAPGRYDLEEVAQWRADTFSRTSFTEDDQDEQYGDMNDAKCRYNVAKADRERALANIAARQDELEQDAYARVEDINLFMGEFFTEQRQLLNRMVIEFAGGYGVKLRRQMRDDLQSRVDLVLKQMHDWTLRTEDLSIETEK